MEKYIERTLVLIKPDAVLRGLTFEILLRFEQAGLKIVAMKMLRASREIVERHYPNTIEWIEGMGNKTLNLYKEYNKNPQNELGTANPREIGEMVKDWNIDYLVSGPMIACVIEGIHAIDVVRKMCGNTMPRYAEAGTIRGSFSSTSAIVANANRRAVKNLIHASSNEGEAEHEIACWFTPQEIISYSRTDEGELY